MSCLFARMLRACFMFGLLAWSNLSVAQGAPITLRRAIDAALAHNPELQTFAFRFRAQDARIEQARLRPAAEASVEFENFAGTGEARNADSLEVTFELSQIIELGGKRTARIEAEQAGRDVIDVERQARQLDVLAQVTRRFITLAARQEQLNLARNALDLAQRTVAGSERRVKAAKSPHAELDRARVAYDRAKLDEARALVGIETARKQLAATWGESEAVIDGQPFAEVQADLYTTPAPREFAELLKRLDANPDFLRFASEARLRDAELRLAATLRRPDVRLSAGVRRLQASDDTALVASFSIPIANSRRARSDIAQAQASRGLVDADRRIAETKAHAMLYELHRELERAVVEARTLKNDILPRTAEALKEVEYAYTRGRYSYIELVDAQREFLSLQAELIEVSANAHGLNTEIERLVNVP